MINYFVTDKNLFLWGRFFYYYVTSYTVMYLDLFSSLPEEPDDLFMGLMIAYVIFLIF